MSDMSPAAPEVVPEVDLAFCTGSDGKIIHEGDVVSVQLARAKRRFEALVTRIVFDENRWLDHVEVVGGPGKNRMMRALRPEQLVWVRAGERKVTMMARKGKNK